VMRERRQLVLSVPGDGFSYGACARDTPSRLCVRTVLCSSAFSLAPPLRSTGSAAAVAVLFARFLATSSTSPHSSSATASGLPDNVPATTGGDADRDLPVPAQKASAHATVYDDAGSERLTCKVGATSCAYLQ
jgi:hypothetical protein